MADANKPKPTGKPRGRKSPQHSLYKTRAQPPPKDLVIPEANKGGAPSEILKPEIRKEIVNSVRMGLHPEVAASMAGINTRTFQSWLLKGKREYGNAESLYAALLQDLITAWSESEARKVSTMDAFATGRPAVYERDKDGKLVMESIVEDGKVVGQRPILLRSEIKPDWRAAMEMLRATFPRRWSYTHHIQQPDFRDNLMALPDNEDGGINKPTVAGSPEELDKAQTRLGTLMTRITELGDDDGI